MTKLKRIQGDKYTIDPNEKVRRFGVTILFTDGKWILVITILKFITIKIDITDFKKGR